MERLTQPQRHALEYALRDMFTDADDFNRFLTLEVEDPDDTFSTLAADIRGMSFDAARFAAIQKATADGKLDALIVALDRRPKTGRAHALLAPLVQVPPDEPEWKRLSLELQRAIKERWETYGDAQRQKRDAIEQLRKRMRVGSSLREGEVIGEQPRFLLARRLDNSGATEVWQAYDLNDRRRPVAVKVIRVPETVPRFWDALVRAVELGELVVPLVSPREGYEEFSFYVTAWMDEGSLWAGTLRPRGDRLLLASDAVQLVLDAARKLAALHARRDHEGRAGVHGAVTPWRILLDKRGDRLCAYLSEPGVPRVVAPGAQPFHAPELLEAPDAAPTPLSDQYELAMTVLFALLAEKGITRVDVSRVPEAYKTALLRATDPVPSRRFASTEDFCRALEDAYARVGADSLHRAADVVAVHDALLAVAGDRALFRGEIIQRMQLDARQLREVDAPSRARSSAQQWHCFVRDLVVLCRDRLSELWREAHALGCGAAPGPERARVPARSVASVPGLYWRLCSAPEGALEQLALRLGFWAGVSPDASTLARRASALLLRQIECERPLDELCAHVDVLVGWEPEGGSPFARQARQSLPWLHEQLLFAIERVCRALTGGSPSADLAEPLVEVERLRELARAREYSWIHAELSGLWRGIVRRRRRDRVEIGGDLHEAFDHLEGAARRLATVTPERGRPRPLDIHAIRGLYRALVALPQELLVRVAEGCDMDAWALPAHDEGIAWQALYVAAYCRDWLPEQLPWTVLWNRLEAYVRDALASDARVSQDLAVKLSLLLKAGDAASAEIKTLVTALPPERDVGDAIVGPSGRAAGDGRVTYGEARALLQTVVASHPRVSASGDGLLVERRADVLLKAPDVHFAELCLYLGEALDTSDREHRIAQMAETCGALDTSTSLLSVAFAYVCMDMPRPIVAPTQLLADTTEPAADGIADRMSRLPPDAYDGLCRRLGVDLARMPSPLASAARRASALLTYCWSLPGGLRKLEQILDAHGVE